MATEIVLDPATGEYVTYRDGVEVARWDPATAIAGLSTPAAGGSSTTIGIDGRAVQPTRAPAAPVAPAPAPGTPGERLAALPDAAPSSRPPARPVSTGQGYFDPGPSGYGDPFSGGGFAGGGGDPFAEIPNYRNGQRHPAAGGAPLVPGGQAAQQSGGGDFREQVYVPGGAAAGPFETRAALPPSNQSYGGYAVDNNGGGGGGGGGGMAGAMIGRIRGNVMDRVGGMGPGGTSSSTTAYRRQQQRYRQQGRRMDRAYDRYNDALAEPNYLPTRGWVKEQGYKPGTVSALLDRPQEMLPLLFPEVGESYNQFTESLATLPMTDLALATFGTQGRSLLSKTPVDKVPKILKKQGVKPVEPDYKRTLDPSKVANRVAELYSTIGNNGTTTFSTAGLLGNLANASNKSAIRQGIQQQFEVDPGGALDSVGSYIKSSILAGMGDNNISRKLMRTADRQLAGADLTGLKPKQADQVLNRIAQRWLD